MAYKLISPSYRSIGQQLYKKVAEGEWEKVVTDIRPGTADSDVNVVPRTKDKARIAELPKGWKTK